MMDSFTSSTVTRDVASSFPLSLSGLLVILKRESPFSRLGRRRAWKPYHAAPSTQCIFSFLITHHRCKHRPGTVPHAHFDAHDGLVAYLGVSEKILKIGDVAGSTGRACRSTSVFFGVATARRFPVSTLFPKTSKLTHHPLRSSPKSL